MVFQEDPNGNEDGVTTHISWSGEGCPDWLEKMNFDDPDKKEYIDEFCKGVANIFDNIGLKLIEFLCSRAGTLNVIFLRKQTTIEMTKFVKFF